MPVRQWWRERGVGCCAPPPSSTSLTLIGCCAAGARQGAGGSTHGCWCRAGNLRQHRASGRRQSKATALPHPQKGSRTGQTGNPVLLPGWHVTGNWIWGGGCHPNTLVAIPLPSHPLHSREGVAPLPKHWDFLPEGRKPLKAFSLLNSPVLSKPEADAHSDNRPQLGAFMAGWCTGP